MKQKTRDMTQGKPAGIIISFAIPLMLGNVFQQMYTVMDSVIVGRGVGVEALAALGTSDWISFTAMGGITGIAQGFSVLIAQYFGAKDEKGMKKTIAMSVWSGVGITLILMALFLGNLGRLLSLLRVPDNIWEDSYHYLFILLIGLAATAFYNISSGILRAMGDSQTPLRAMVIASVTNIILDLLFVMGFHWGVEGAAIATVTAQVCSGAICTAQLGKYGVWKIEKEDWKWDWELVKRLLALGLPVAFQNVIIGFGGIVIQYVINGFGFLYVAGFTATNKLYGLFELAAVSFGYATSSFVGQYLGGGGVWQNQRRSPGICSYFCSHCGNHRRDSSSVRKGNSSDFYFKRGCSCRSSIRDCLSLSGCDGSNPGYLIFAAHIQISSSGNGGYGDSYVFRNRRTGDED